MIALPFFGRLPVRDHLRPPPRAPRLGAHVGVFTESDVDPRLLRIYSTIVDHLNLCSVDVWAGEGRPGAGWDGWTSELVALDVALALALPCGGEA